MRIWLLQIGERLPGLPGVKKMRTGFLVDKLVRRGHTVVWWSSAFDHFQKAWIDSSTIKGAAGGAQLILLKGCGYQRNVSLKRYLDHRLVAHRFRAMAPQEQRPDIIVASLPAHDLAYEAVRFGAQQKIPVIVDVRDPWPDVFLSGLPPWASLLAREALRWDYNLLKGALGGATSILACTHTFLEWALEKVNRERGPLDGVFPLGGESLVLPGSGRTYDSTHPFVVAFIGTFSTFHNPEILLECAEKMKRDNVQFVLAGDGIHLPLFRRRGAHLPHVELPGWLNDREIQTLLGRAHVGVCPSNRPASLFPNKAFTYLSGGLPILSSFDGDLRSLIERERIGFHYTPKDVASLCRHIEFLKSNWEIYHTMSQRARDIFETHFNVETVYNSYVDHIEHVAGKGR